MAMYQFILPNSVAKNPKTEKIANPAKTEVKQLPKQTIMVSLKNSTLYNII